MSTRVTPEHYGQLALITGASSGIGEQFARLLAARGFDLALVARREPALQALAAQLRNDYAVQVTLFPCDLSDSRQVDGLISALQPLSPGLIISNAGYGVPKGKFLDSDADAAEAMYMANAIAPARIARQLLPAMLKRGRGGIIFTGSMEGDAVFPYSAPYAASKAFLHSLVLGLWHEVRGSGVDVLLLAPGSTDTNAPISQGISREQLVGVMSPADVAGQALQSLGRQPQLITGWHNRLFIGLLRILPRRWAIAIAGAGMKQAIDNSAAAT